MTYISSAISSALHNETLSGFGLMAVIGGVFYHLRGISSKISSLAVRYTTVSLTVTSGQMAFIWVEKFLSGLPSSNKVRAVSMKSYEDYSSPDSNQQHNSMDWHLPMGPGRHIIWFDGTPVFIERDIEMKTGQNKPTERICLKFIGLSQRKMRNFADLAFKTTAQTAYARIYSWDGYWRSVAGKMPRSLNTITLKDRQMERILSDFRWFSGASAWYSERGIPYRRGYLFSGPPGCGKTSFVLALGCYFSRPIAILRLPSLNSDADLETAISQAPTNSIVVIEDIDCVKAALDRDAGDPQDGPIGVTHSGLLNALDGITTPDGRVIIMTTNYKDRLDAAVIRPGRADVHETFELLDAASQMQMASRFYDSPFTPLLEPISPASLQAAFMRYPTDIEAARLFLLTSEKP